MGQAADHHTCAGRTIAAGEGRTHFERLTDLVSVDQSLLSGFEEALRLLTMCSSKCYVDGGVTAIAAPLKIVSDLLTIAEI